MNWVLEVEWDHLIYTIVIELIIWFGLSVLVMWLGNPFVVLYAIDIETHDVLVDVVLGAVLVYLALFITPAVASI